MEKEKNIIQMVNYYLKENIKIEKNGMEKGIAKKVKSILKLIKEKENIII